MAPNVLVIIGQCYGLSHFIVITQSIFAKFSKEMLYKIVICSWIILVAVHKFGHLIADALQLLIALSHHFMRSEYDACSNLYLMACFIGLYRWHFDGLMQNRHNSSALAMELPLICINWFSHQLTSHQIFIQIGGEFLWNVLHFRQLHFCMISNR